MIDEERLERVSQIACETFAITQLELQLLSVIAGVFKQQGISAPEGLTQLALTISNRSQAVLSLIAKEATVAKPTVVTSDIFGLSSPSE